jgi:RNA polymerase sigma-70 factor (ECF subfamily)
MLAEDAAFYGDGGGKAPQIWQPVVGGEAVARMLAGFARVSERRGYTIRLVDVNGDPGLLGFDAEGTLIAAQAFEISDGVVWAIRSIVNPEKLAHISSTILPSLPPA